MALPGDLEPPRPWVHAPALEVIHTSAISLVERTKDGIRKRCWGASARFSQQALAFLKAHPSLDKYFVKVLDDAYLVDDHKKPCHLTLLEEYDYDAFCYGEKFGARPDYKAKAMPLIHFVVEAHQALDAVKDASFVFPDVKLENLLVNVAPDGTVKRVVWGDLESLRPYPCTTPLRYTLYYLPPSMIVAALDANTAYFEGKRKSIRGPHARHFTKSILKEQVAVFAACLLTGSFPPVEVWWAAFENKSVGSVLLRHLETMKWWNPDWNESFRKAPFSLASWVSKDTMQTLTDCLQNTIYKLFMEDVEGEYMEACKEEHFPLGPLNVWLDFLKVAFSPSTNLDDLKATAFLQTC